MSEWIDIKDRLPDSDDFVLVFLDSRIDLMFYDHEDGLWKDKEWMDWEITHWMPIPEPPKV